MTDICERHNLGLVVAAAAGVVIAETKIQEQVQRSGNEAAHPQYRSREDCAVDDGCQAIVVSVGGGQRDEDSSEGLLALYSKCGGESCDCHASKLQETYNRASAVPQ